MAFQLADKAMYLLGPVLITVASAIIIGLTYVYFMILLPMLAGTNWVLTISDLSTYWKERGYVVADENEGRTDDGLTPISRISSVLIALSTPIGMFHTLLVSFFLVNILYNYYKCVLTSNSGPRFNVVVRQMADFTGFHYPETEVELLQFKRDFERKIYVNMQRQRNEILSRGAASNGTGARLGATHPENTRNGEDQEAQESQSSPLMATSTATPQTTAAAPVDNIAKGQLPRLWQLLSPTEWGYCRYSSQPKPPRSHYDHVTKALVLNMDHYCPWMFNCVGYFNYRQDNFDSLARDVTFVYYILTPCYPLLHRYFFNFLWFVVAALWYGTALCFPAFMYTGGKEYRDQVRMASRGTQIPLKDLVVRHIQSNPFIPTPAERTLVSLAFMLCVCLAAAVTCLGGFHLYLVLSAQTTIEFHSNFSKRRKAGWKNPYSAGSWKKNWEMIYGTLYWSRHRAGGSCENEDEEHSRCHGFGGILMAMMPSKREPEFLPFPINERLIRRRNKHANYNVTDLEMASSEVIANGMSATIHSEETEFMMDSKCTYGPLVERARASKSADGGQMSRD